MSKFVSLGIKRKEEFGSPEPFDSKKHQEEIVFPGFSIRANVPEELFKFEPDDDIRAEVVIRIKSKGTDEDSSSKKKEMRLQVRKIKVIGKNKMTREEFKKASDDDRDSETKRLKGIS